MKAGRSESTKAADPRPFEPVSSTFPARFHEELCADLRAKGTGLTVRVVVPDSGSRSHKRDNGCYLDLGRQGAMSVTIAPNESAASYRTKFLDPYEDGGGDDSVSDIVEEHDVPAFGGREGEELVWRSSNDGQPMVHRLVQSGGVRVIWSTPEGRSDRSEELRVVRESLAVRAGTTSLCAGVRHAVPVQHTESIEAGAGRCHLYLQPGRGSLLRYAEVAPSPRQSLPAQATRLRGDPEVTSVRLEHGAARLDGRRVDRLTWVVTRLRETPDYQPPGTWRLVTVGDDRLQATWGATPRQWRAERAVVRSFFASVRAVSTD